MKIKFNNLRLFLAVCLTSRKKKKEWKHRTAMSQKGVGLHKWVVYHSTTFKVCVCVCAFTCGNVQFAISLIVF